MTFFAILLALATAAAGVWCVRDAKDEFARLHRSDWATLLLLTVLGVVVSLFTFDAIGHHAFRAHEEQLFAVFSGQAERSSFHPAEVQLLMGWVYETIGRVAGGSTLVFVVAAILFGAGGPLLAGLSGRLLTGRWIGGALPALLLALQPTLAYWRVHGFHVAPAQVAFSACVLAAVLVLKRGSRPAYSAWFLLGALTVFLRLEYAGAVGLTALLPLLGGRVSDLRRKGAWGPGLLVAAGLFAVPEFQLLFAVEQREDYRVGFRFLALHVPVFVQLAIGAFGGGVAVLGLAAAGCGMGEHRRSAVALVLVAAGSVALPLVFMDFGMRHTLPGATAIYLAAGAGAVALDGRFRGAGKAAAAAAVILLAIPWAGDLTDLGERYGKPGSSPPTLPDTDIPDDEPPAGWMACALYSNVGFICDSSPYCHPVKDMRDPALVRARWDKYDGCVYWTVDASYAEVAGVQHEWWPILRALYPSEPVGLMTEPNRGDGGGEVHMYRLTERP
jgi:hypothetical protein